MPTYRINSPKVIHQVFDTEVVAVNQEAGSYYCIEGTGVDVWRMLEAQTTDDDIVATLTGSGTGMDAESIRTFLREVIAGGLLVVESDPSAIRPTGDAGATFSPDRTLPLDPPTVRKFTDMRDLLLLDPIHELDEAGWPQRAQAGA